MLEDAHISRISRVYFMTGKILFWDILKLLLATSVAMDNHVKS